MSQLTSPIPPPPDALDRLLADRPDLALMIPYLGYLVLLAARDFLPYDWRWVAALLRGAGGLWLVWRVRRHLPPWGAPHVALAAACGLIAAAGWFYGQYFFNAIGVPHRLPLPLFPGVPSWSDPRSELAADGLFWVGALGASTVFWLDVVTRIAVASTTVAFVEELFWRAFLLRAFINWGAFEKLPLGTFAWRSFLLTSLLSTVQHPDNWAVSIPCWFFFNALMIWKRSVLFMVLVHGFTNLFLYAWVIWHAVARGDGSVWMFW
jgi:membrane protease YdiL (CAAX protease family)